VLILVLLLTWACIRHAQKKGLFVNLLKVLVVKLLAVYALAARAIALCEVSALDHKRLDDTVERRSLVVQGFPRLALAFLAGAEGTEIFGRLWYD